MNNEIIFIVENDLEGGYFAKSLEHSIHTQAETIEDLKSMIKDALDCHFDNNSEKPSMIRLHFINDEVFAYA